MSSFVLSVGIFVFLFGLIPWLYFFFCFWPVSFCWRFLFVYTSHLIHGKRWNTVCVKSTHLFAHRWHLAICTTMLANTIDGPHVKVVCLCGIIWKLNTVYVTRSHDCEHARSMAIMLYNPLRFKCFAASLMASICNYKPRLLWSSSLWFSQLEALLSH